MTDRTLNVIVQVSDPDVEEPRHVRHQFDLHVPTEHGQVTRHVIIDVPLDPSDITDVWVLGHTVEVGDSPEDGFATYTPFTPKPHRV